VETIGRFARKAAVSQRTLRFYDRLGLLPPARYTPAGYRLYDDEELVRLQQILALKFLGFSLDEVKAFLAAGPSRLQEVLHQQKAMMREKRAQLDAIVTAIEETERLLRDDPDAWEPIVKVIEVIQMQQKNDWVGKYFTPEQQKKMQQLSESSYTDSAREKLAARGGTWTEEDQKQASAQWEWVFAELKRLAAAGADPSGPEAQEWARVRTGLLDAFTQRDPEIEAGLNAFWKNVSRMPAAERPVALPEQSEAETAFMERALAVYQGRARS
jgi:DNA-binding transcriptional MerR regulator